jgi:hypothetical protein
VQLTTAMLRTLKGSPLSVLMALALAGQPVSATWLETVTGYTDKSIQSGLNVLVEFGLATRNGRYYWQIADGVAQLPLMVPELEELAEEIFEAPVDPEPAVEISIDSEKFRLGIIPSQSLASGFNQNLDQKESSNPPLARGPDDSEKFRLNSAALDENGIREPARSRLAALEHVHPRLIRYHCARATNTGMAVYRIEHNWAVPDDWEDPIEWEDVVGEQTTGEDPDDQPEVLTSAPPKLIEEFRRAINKVGASPAEFHTWLLPLQPAGLDTTGALVALAGNRFACDWLDLHVKRRLEEILGVDLRFEVRSPP